MHKKYQINDLESANEKIRALQEEVATLKNFINNIPADIYWKDKHGVWQGMNRQCGQSLLSMGFISRNDEKEIKGKTDYDIFSKKTADGYRKNDLEVLENNTEVYAEEKTLTPSGEVITLLSKKTPYYGNDHSIVGLIGMTIDITKRKKLEQELHEAKLKAEEADKTKSEFIANMSHDIRTPLTGIISLSGILEDEVTNPEHKEHAHMLNISGEQLLSLLNSVLDIVISGTVQDKKLQLVQFDLEEMLHNLFELELPALQVKSITLHLDMDNNIPKIIETDKGKLYRILLNLISNAIKFTSEGSVTLKASLVKGKKAPLTTDTPLRTSDFLEFIITDSGIGIAEKDKDKIFETFFRASPSYEGKFDGHGVGLSIVKQYITALGGTIDVQSKINEGTSIKVSIPFKKVSQETIKTRQLQKAIKTITKIESSPDIIPQENRDVPFVLVIEDNPMAMKVACTLLKKRNCQYKSAKNATEAFKLVQTQRFDFILSDIGLPDYSGFILAQKIREYEKNKNLPITPIIGLTAHGKQKADAKKAVSAMHEVLEKPLTLKALDTLTENYCKEKHSQATSTDSPVEEHSESETPPLFEYDKALALLGSPQAVFETIEYMRNEELVHAIAEIHKAFEKKDWPTFKAHVHKFKSSCLYSATTELLNITKKLQDVALDDDEHTKEMLYKQFQQSLDNTKKHLDDWLQKHSTNTR